MQSEEAGQALGSQEHALPVPSHPCSIALSDPTPALYAFAPVTGFNIWLFFSSQPQDRRFFSKCKQKTKTERVLLQRRECSEAHQNTFHSPDRPSPPTSTSSGIEIARALPPAVYPGRRRASAMPALTRSLTSLHGQGKRWASEQCS